jgi:hypothetical protein
LDRQIGSQFYERLALSKNKAAMREKAEHSGPGDLVSPEEGIKDPLVLEFLDLKDEYSESELEQASFSTSRTSSWSWAMILPPSAASAGFVSTTPGFVSTSSSFTAACAAF